MDASGFRGFERIIRDFKQGVVVGMEPTGIYHYNLLNFLCKSGYNGVVVNPYMLHKLFKREIEILSSIPGIGKESAIYLMAELVDIKRFSNYRKLVGFCGLEPTIKQSGKFKAGFRISKRGNVHARRIVWIMAGCVKRSCPYFREYYLKKRAEGKSYKEAVVATSTKLLRTIYALLNESRVFK
jgi:transposase